MDTRRKRGSDGRFVCGLNSESNAALRKHRVRQRQFVARRTRERKGIMATFVACFVIQKQNEEEHWMPGLNKDCLLLDLMETLIKEKFLDSRRSRLGTAKTIFFDHVPGAATKRLPRIAVYPADSPQKVKERVDAFVGWRFPCPMDLSEIECVDKWLHNKKSKLRVSVAEGKKVGLEMFRRYIRRPKRSMFIVYPLKSSPDPRLTLSDLARNGLDQASEGGNDVLESGDGRREQSSIAGSSIDISLTQNLSEDAVILGAREVMKVASTDFYYRSLLLILNPTCDVRLDVVCYAWMKQFKEGKPQEEWCGLMKDIFEYCRLVAKKDTASDSFRQLKSDLTDELTTFKLIRSSRGLPLFEGSSSLIEQAFERRETI